MSEDIAKRLRAEATARVFGDAFWGRKTSGLFDHAAEEIQHLRAEVARLRGEVAELTDTAPCGLSYRGG